MRARTIVAIAVSAFIGAACAGNIKMSGSVASPDESLRMVAVVWIGPGKDERKHDVYVGIGDKADNPATKYFQTKRTYILSRYLDWHILWLSTDRARIDFSDCPEYTSLRQYPDPLCVQLDSIEVVREAVGDQFREVETTGPKS